MNRVKLYFDAKTRRIRRASNWITALCKFEKDSQAFADGLGSALKELRRN